MTLEISHKERADRSYVKLSLEILARELRGTGKSELSITEFKELFLDKESENYSFLYDHLYDILEYYTRWNIIKIDGDRVFLNHKNLNLKLSFHNM